MTTNINLQTGLINHILFPASNKFHRNFLNSSDLQGTMLGSVGTEKCLKALALQNHNVVKETETFSCNKQKTKPEKRFENTVIKVHTLCYGRRNV